MQICKWKQNSAKKIPQCINCYDTKIQQLLYKYAEIRSVKWIDFI